MTDIQRTIVSPVSGSRSVLQRNKRVVVLCLIIAGLAINFWVGSRVPSLNEKAAMGGEVLLEDPLGFDVVYVVDRADSVPVKVLKTTVNWAKTNRKGMTFGVLFGAALMSLFALLRRRAFKSSIANSSLGIMIGAPLGVCVNCVTPIAQGIHNAGARLETSLAMMLSSPTLNIIVVTMLIALFPPYFVAIKLGLTLAFILFGIPLLARYFARNGVVGLNPDLTITEGSCPIDLSPRVDPDESWLNAVVETVKSYFRNLWYIIKTTVPLMLLAGFLGALVITVVPWEMLSGLFESRGGRLYNLLGEFGVALIGLSIVAAVGIFLPIPIAFDVMIVAILFSAGMPVHYAMTLLFTLGIFSIYPFIIIWRDISRPVAIALPIILSALGVVAGLAAMSYYSWDTNRKTEVFLAAFSDSNAPPAPPPVEVRASLEGDALRRKLAKNPHPAAVPVTSVDALSIERTPFAPRNGSEGLTFQKIEGRTVGIDEPQNFSLELFNRPYEFRGAIATGDVHNDGWPDIVVSSTDYLVSLYANIGGESYSLQKVELPELSGAFIFLTSLVDLNDDGWLDLFLSTYMRGNWVVYNKGGEFLPENLQQMPNTKSFMTAAATFGDVDEDGDLDAVMGNWSRWQRHPNSQNALLLNGPDGFEARGLPGMVGETLSTLLTDFDSDGHLDLLVGNDFNQPDIIYRGDGRGGFENIGSKDKMFPHTTETTMSITSADLDNDLSPELYFTQVTGRSTNTDHAREAPGESLCEEISDAGQHDACLVDIRQWHLVRRSVGTRDTLACLKIDDLQRRDECVVHHLTKTATRWHRDPSKCDLLPERWSTMKTQCYQAFEDRHTYTEAEYAANIPQIRNYNVLLQRGENGAYVDRATDMNVAITGWTWNAKFADLDNDEWVDLFAVNGMFESKTRESNYLYQNTGGDKFEDRSVEAGILDYHPTPSYSYVDLDNDGDLDMVTAPTHGPVSVYKNGSGNGNAIAFELRDMQGNRFGLGSRVVIYYGDGRKQMREIQSGGGFLSFDPAVAHFGLGTFDAVERVEIHWSTSERNILEGPFEAEATYRITRNE